MKVSFRILFDGCWSGFSCPITYCQSNRNPNQIQLPELNPASPVPVNLDYVMLDICFFSSMCWYPRVVAQLVFMLATGCYLGSSRAPNTESKISFVVGTTAGGGSTA